VRSTTATGGFESIFANVHCDDLSSECPTDHHGGQANASTPMHCKPFAGPQPSLVRNGSKRGGEAASETGSGHVTERIREGDKVDVGMSDFDVFGKGSPLSESGLGVMIADLRMTAAALFAGAAAAAERNSDALASTPLFDIPPQPRRHRPVRVRGHAAGVHHCRVPSIRASRCDKAHSF
jgi:hypothetical protein